MWTLDTKTFLKFSCLTVYHLYFFQEDYCSEKKIIFSKLVSNKGKYVIIRFRIVNPVCAYEQTFKSQ